MIGMSHQSFLFQRKTRSSLNILNLDKVFFPNPIRFTLEDYAPPE